VYCILQTHSTSLNGVHIPIISRYFVLCWYECELHPKLRMSRYGVLQTSCGARDVQWLQEFPDPHTWEGMKRSNEANPNSYKDSKAKTLAAAKIIGK